MKVYLSASLLLGAALGAAAGFAFPARGISRPIMDGPAINKTADAPALTRSRAVAGSSRESAEANGENITDRGRSDKLERANDIDRYKIDELIADPYWNPKKIELDAARRDVLNKLIEDGRRREKAARSQWNRLSLTSTQKMESAGRYATGIAMPASIYTNLNAPDVATAVANLTSGLEAPHFKVWYRIVLPASDFPMLTVSKRRLDDARIFLHDAVKRYF